MVVVRSIFVVLLNKLVDSSKLGLSFKESGIPVPSNFNEATSITRGNVI